MEIKVNISDEMIQEYAKSKLEEAIKEKARKIVEKAGDMEFHAAVRYATGEVVSEIMEKNDIRKMIVEEAVRIIGRKVTRKATTEVITHLMAGEQGEG